MAAEMLLGSVLEVQGAATAPDCPILSVGLDDPARAADGSATCGSLA
jgi:hypothetical protein